MKQTITNWGNYPRVQTSIKQSKFKEAIIQQIKSATNIIARGNGRCYGDSSLSQNICSTLQLNKILSFDEVTGIFECQSGMLLSEVLKIIVPKGFFLPVTPGTKFITIGGAIAADVHGKNHHKVGCFSKHVFSFDLLLENGTTYQCTPNQNVELFWQTCGGMGLTGIILSAKFHLKKIETAFIRQKTIKAANLSEVMQLFEANEQSTYSVAWIDCLAKGKNLGKSLLMLGEHANLSNLNNNKKPLRLHHKQQLSIPFYFPTFALNPLTINAFNFLYYNKQWATVKDNIIHYEPFFYPLDSIGNWNKMYGKKGFTQYQFVLPMENSRVGLSEILQTIADSGEGSFLAVLKLFGTADSRAIMSFPKRGYTLALDFKISPKVFLLLNQLDQLVLKYGGRLYLAKDARMSADFFKKTYPKKVEKNPTFNSLQAQRLKF